MTSPIIEALQRRVGHFPIELPAAALAAAAVAFVTVALPDWRFESAVAASGLGGILEAARPPLGQTARLVAALVLGGLSFLAVWFGLRALDRKPVASDFPAFRAADLHPDAPRRRPILAGAEFGGVVDPLPSIEEQIGRRKLVLSDPLPSFLAPQPAAIGDFVPAPQPEDAEYVELTEEDGKVEPSLSAPSARFEQRLPETFQPAPDKADPLEVQAPTGGAEKDGSDDETVADLMARLETGLTQRGDKPLAPGPAGPAQEELRRALGDLNRISGRAR